MITRKAKLDDIPAIVEIAVESVSREKLPLTIDREAMAGAVQTCLGPAHFAWVTEVDGKVVAAVIGFVQKGFWFERMQCSVLMYYSTVPNGGLPLIREFVRWVKSRSGIKMAIIELEPSVDKRLVEFFKRVGFNRESTNLTFVRGV